MRSESLVVVHEEDDDNDEVLADKQDLIYKKILFHILRYDHKLQYITIVARMCNILQCS